MSDDITSPLVALKVNLTKVMMSQGYPWLKRDLTESNDVGSSGVASKVNITNSNNVARLPMV